MARTTTDDEGDEAVIDAAIAVIVASYSIERALKGMRRMALRILRRAKPAPATDTTTGGLPCAAEFCWDPGPQPAAAVDSSAMIPPEQRDRADRGGE